MKIKNILLLPLLLSLSVVYAEKRALVIGNSDYKNAKLSYLPNATKDAKLIKETLEKLGFKVLPIYGANKQAMDNAISQFADSIKKGDTVFFYYAGHGISQGGQNYLIPLKSGIKSAINLPYRAQNAKEILDLMSDQAKNSIFVLDACRNVAFKRSIGRGLKSFNNNTGTYVIYSADEGQAASDNRVFAKSLANELLKPQSIRDVALETRKAVYKSSRGEQYPATYDKLLSKVYLNGKPIQNNRQSSQTADITQPAKQGKRISHYIAYDDGTALDKNTGLLWQRCSVGQQWNGSMCTGKAKEYKWAEAMKLGNNGWRLPTIEELGTIVYCSSGKTMGVNKYGGSIGCAGDYQRPTIYTTVFPIKMKYPFYWSSSPYPGINNGAWDVYFYYGHDHYGFKGGNSYVRLVRGGQ